MGSQKLVIRYIDGRTRQGYATNFDPAAPQFTLMPPPAEAQAKPEQVEVKALKAVFFVRDFAGRPGRQDKKVFEAGQPYQGRKIKVQFADGEVLVGSTPNYASTLPGFFIFPADPQSNTIKVFAVATSVKSVAWL